MKYKKILLFVLMIACAGMVCLGGCGSSPEQETVPEEEITLQESSLAEDATIESLEEENAEDVNLDGSTRGKFTTTDLQGNEVTQEIFTESELTVLNVWATYCNPCIREMPYLSELSKEYDSSVVQFVGVPMDVYNEEYLSYAYQLIEDTGADYTHLLLSQELYDWGLSDIQAVPTTFFVNKEGEIVKTIVGSFSKEYWKMIIDEQLASM